MVQEKKSKQVATVFFFDNWNGGNLLKIASHINDEFEEIFDGHPFILPVDDAPVEIPRIVLKNSEETIALQISAVQATLVVENSCNIEQNISLSDELTSKLTAVFIQTFGWKINRLGRVLNLEVSLTESGVDFLLKKYISKKHLSESSKIQLNWLRKLKWEKDLINHWVRLNSSEELNNNENSLQIILDTNLVESEDRTVEIDFANDFYEKVAKIEEDTLSEIFQ